MGAGRRGRVPQAHACPGRAGAFGADDFARADLSAHCRTPGGKPLAQACGMPITATDRPLPALGNTDRVRGRLGARTASHVANSPSATMRPCQCPPPRFRPCAMAIFLPPST
ncbi:hypothetical protein XAP6164_1670005 [Xanthomonas phaseoli pv. phaseoli]|nr:hypothetical protein XAP6164_1670005 [Xanthomonas phaseoli pv. phaseoli]